MLVPMLLRASKGSIQLTLSSRIRSKRSSPAPTVFMVTFDEASTLVVPRYQVTVGSGLALQRHRIVISEPVALGVILGFSTNVGAIPPSSEPLKLENH